MGDPKKFRKKYSPPAHPWNSLVIEEGKALRREYGLNTSKEILIARSFLKKYKDIAKRLIADQTEQGQKERQQMLEKLQHFGLLSVGAEVDHVLSLTLKNILERRIQSVVFRKGLARTIKQARQFITHRHIQTGNREITSPGHIITLEEEAGLSFKEKSTLADAEHPERVVVAPVIAESGKKDEQPVEEVTA